MRVCSKRGTQVGNAPLVPPLAPCVMRLLGLWAGRRLREQQHIRQDAAALDARALRLGQQGRVVCARSHVVQPQGLGAHVLHVLCKNEGSSSSSRWPARSTAATAQAPTSERAAPRGAGGCRQRSRRVGARPWQAQKGGFDIRRIVAQQVLSKANWRVEVAQTLAAAAAATSCSSNCVRHWLIQLVCHAKHTLCDPLLFQLFQASLA